jgi:hypothetical protein
VPEAQAFARAQLDSALALIAGEQAPAEPIRLLALYHAVPLALLDKTYLPDPRIAGALRDELARVRSMRGFARTLLCPRGIDYTMFTPRGHYTNFRLQGYFQAMTFYAQCSFDLETEAGVERAVDVARLVDAPARARLARLRRFAALLTGAPDDPGVEELRRALPRLDSLARLPARLPAGELLTAVRGLARGRVPAQGAVGEAPRLTFHLLGAGAVPDSLLFAATTHPSVRPFPSALDLLAALGSQQARALLAGDMARLPALGSALASRLPAGGTSIYHHWLEVLRQVLSRPAAPRRPTFELSDAWARHLLVAAAGSWAELRHDTLLYVKQPLLWMQGGHEAELPARLAGGYVEPRPDVYRALLALLDLVESELAPAAAASAPPAARSLPISPAGAITLRDLLHFLVEVSELELAGRPIPPAVDRRLRQIGRELEELTRGRADALPDQALVADVHTVVGADGQPRTLEVGIGRVDELWVLVPRGGRLLLTRGGVFSYHEFVGEPGVRLNDNQWNQRLRQGNVPPRPAWARPLPAMRPAQPVSRSNPHLLHLD